jgi:hypothetical protein
MSNFKFFKKNDGTELFPNTINDNYFLHERITELETYNNRLIEQLTECQDRLLHHASRVYPDITTLRDEQRIDRTVALQFTNRDDFFMHLRRQQVTRIAEKLLENNLIDHTFSPDEPNGDYVSRMKIKVQTL